jgi:hypothetical protein
MKKNKYNVLKQWFTFTCDEKTDLLYFFTNNHYIHTWFENNGHTKFENVLTLNDYDLFIQAINDSTNVIPDEFDKYFPDYFIEDYSLWDNSSDNYWSDNRAYRENCKFEMEKIFDILWDINDDMEGHTGVLKYHIYHNTLY